MAVSVADRAKAVTFFKSQAKELDVLAKRVKRVKRGGKSAVALTAMAKQLQKMAFADDKATIWLNALNSDSVPFNFYKGNRDVIRHTAFLPPIGAAMYCVDGMRLLKSAQANPAKFEAIRQEALSRMRYVSRAYQTLAKIASGKFKPKAIDLNKAIKEVIEDRVVYAHDPMFEAGYKEKLESLPKIKGKAVFDPDALYWILFRQLSNAENASIPRNSTWINLAFKEAKTHHEIRVEDKEIGIKARAATVGPREGGKSVPNIEAICRALNASFHLEPLGEGTASILRLPKPRHWWNKIPWIRTPPKLKTAFEN